MKEKLLRQLEPRCGCELGASRGESANEIPRSDVRILAVDDPSAYTTTAARGAIEFELRSDGGRRDQWRTLYAVAASGR